MAQNSSTPAGISPPIPGLISVNGRVSSPETAVVPALDRGFLFGDDVFETLVAFHGKVLNAEAHLARLRRSAEALYLEIPWSDQELMFELTGLAEQVPHPKLALRLVITRGNGMGLKPAKGTVPNRVVYCTKAGEESIDAYRDGIALKRTAKGSTERGAAPKTGNYLASVIAVQRAEREGFHEILWTNGDGEITEAATANVFLIARQGDQVEIVTPSAQSGILLGLTRGTLIDLLARATIPVHEQIIFADELPRFDEAFLCSTVRGLVPISRIDGHKLHTARSTSVFRHIERLFFTWAETQLGFRVDWRTGAKV